MIVLGLTGSIGMGKSTAAGFFREAGIAVHDADAVVHALYSGKAAPLIEAEFPGTVHGGTVDRARLAEQVVGHSQAMRRLERIVHPLVSEARKAFLAEARRQGNGLVVLDIPLLYETGSEKYCDQVAVVSAPPAVQRERVLARPGMTEEKFKAILAKQLPDAEKRRRADHVIDSSQGFDAARRQVFALVEQLAGR